MKKIIVGILLISSISSMEKSSPFPCDSFITVITSDKIIVEIEQSIAENLLPGLMHEEVMDKEDTATIVLKDIDSATLKIIIDHINFYNKQINNADDYLFELGKALSHYQSSDNYPYTQSKPIQRLIRTWGIISGKRMAREFDPELIRLIAIRSSGKSLSASTLERITRCKNLTELNLSKFSLSSVPVEFLHPNLRTLNLSKNGLTKLPEDLSPLESLEHLYCTDNNLTELPASLFALTNLKTLNISSNQLTILCHDIGKLKNLKYLSVEANKLSEIPTQIGLLTQLTKLVLGSNKLTYLPTELAFLCNLKELWSDHNELEELPPILSCTQLKLLWLCKNKIKRLPEDCSSLITLERLNLEDNRLKTLPATLKELPKLNVLLLDKNHFDHKTTKQIKEDFDHLGALSI